MMRELMQLRSIQPAERPARLLVRTPPEPVHPAQTGQCVQALERLCAGGGARWAVTGWCTDLAGPWRSVARVADDGNSSREALTALVGRLAPEPAREEWPSWMNGSTDPVMLSVGQSAGKPGVRTLVDIPAAAADLAVDIGGGLVRFSYPQWSGDPLHSDGRLLALRELARWRGDGCPPDAVRVLAGWAAGPGRAFCGRWAWNRGLPECKTPAARAALQELALCSVEDVVAQVLSW